MRSTFRIAGKDLRERLRDRSALMIAVVLPLALTFVYNLVFGSASQPRAFRYAVADLDRGSIAQALAEDPAGDDECRAEHRSALSPGGPCR